MSSVAARKPRVFTAAEYLMIERGAEFKSEFFDGQIFAMSGASRKHNLIALNVSRELSQQLRGRPCETYAADMRVKVDPMHYTYPDIVVACGDIRFEDAEVDTLVTPTVIIEVLSPSTEVYDRGTKSARYRRMPSLREYVLIAQDRVYVEHLVRQDDSWLLTETDDPGAVLSLPSIGCELRLADVYERVELAPESGNGRGVAP